MKKAMFLYSLFSLSMFLCTAQTKAKQEKMDTNYLLWKVSGKDLKKPSYVFGTIHLICPDDYVWTDAMQQALDASEKVALELNLDDPNLQMQVAMGMMDKDGKSLKSYFSDAEYATLSEFVQSSMGVSLASLDQMKPIALVSLLSTKTVDCASPVSYEERIATLAKKDSKEIIGLETVEDQLRIFNEMDLDSSARQVVRSLDDMSAMKSQYSSMLSFYTKQDLAGLYNMVLESPDFKDNLNVLLFDRNIRWIPKMEELAKQQSMFFAVGAGHLWGEKGVLQLLKDAGYTVEGVR